MWLDTRPDRVGNKKKSTDIIPALFVKNNSGKLAPYTILYSHGNAADISQEEDYLKEMAETTGCDVFHYEYPGYSLSKFTPTDENYKLNTTQAKVYKAIEASFRYLVNERNVEPSRIILIGRSIGSGPSTHLASLPTLSYLKPGIIPSDIGGLFLISPFLSTVRAVIGKKTAMVCCCFDNFPNHKKIKKVKCPVAVMHARDDE